MDDKKKMKLFWAALIIILVIVVVIVVVMSNTKKSESTVVPPVQQPVVPGNKEPYVNPDAKPEDKPSIGGSDNVEQSNGIKTNVSPKFKDKVTYKSYTLSDIALIYQDGKTSFSAKVTSTATEKVPGEGITIKLFDKSGKYLSQLGAYIPQVKPGESSTLLASSTSDLTNAYSLEIVAQ